MARSKPSGRRTARRPSTSRMAMLARLGFRKPAQRSRSGRGKPGKERGTGSLWARPKSAGPTHGRLTFPSEQMLPALGVAVLVALAMAALRVDLIRGRYEIGMDYHKQAQLNRQLNRLTASMRELRDPARLGQFAKEMGFALPERLIDLPMDTETPPASDGSTATQFAGHNLRGSSLP